MARFKDFDAAEAERKGEPITFQLGGREWTAAHINAAAFLALARRSADGGDAAILAFDDYITNTLAEKDRKPFRKMLADKEVQLSTLVELGQWIVEQATGNPTAGASPSQEAPSSSGQPLRVMSLDPVSTSEEPLSGAG